MKSRKKFSQERPQNAPERLFPLTNLPSRKRVRNSSLLIYPTRTSMITRAFAARMASRPICSEIFIPFPIQDLPAELKDMIFQMLLVKDLKSVRVVCKNWLAFASRYVGIKNPTLDDSTFETLEQTEQIFKEMTIKTLLSKKSIPRHPSRFLPGKTIQKITFDRSEFLPGNLEWVFAACPNVEEIQIYEFDRPYEFPENSPAILPSPWLQHVSVCKNLKSLKIDILPRQSRRADMDLFRHIGFDCEPLALCTKLTEFKIVGLAPFYITNCDKLPPSMRNFSVLLLLEMFETVEHFDQFYENICAQCKIAPSLAVHVPPEEDASQIRRYFTIMRLFPHLTPIRIVSRSSLSFACADALHEIIEVKKRHEKYARIVASILYFNHTYEITD